MERFEVASGAVRLVGERTGAGEPLVVLLHAGIADRRSWRDVAPGLPGTVVAYDRRGFGDTPPGDTPFTHVDDLVAVLDAVGDGTPAWLVGSSMGGALALDAAVLHPERVTGLVLIAPAVSGEPQDVVIDADTLRIVAEMEAAADAEIANRLEVRLWLDGPAQPEGRVAGPARELALAMNAIVIGHGVEEGAGASELEAWTWLEEVQPPLTMAWGDLDVPAVIAECETIAARVPGATTHVFHGTAHLPYLEQPQAVAELVRAALGR